MATPTLDTTRAGYAASGNLAIKPRDNKKPQGGVVAQDITAQVKAARDAFAFAVQLPPQDFCIATIQQCLSPKNGLGGLNFVIEDNRHA